MLSTGSLPPFTLNLDAGTNAVTITADGAGNTDIFVNQLMTGAPADVVPVGTPIAITGSGGNDTYTVNYSSGDPIPGGLSVDTTAGGAALPTLVVEGVVTGTGAAPNFTLSSSTASGTGVVVSNASVDDTINLSGVANLNLFPGTDTGTDTGTLNVASGSFAFNQDLGVAGNGVDVSVQSGATVAFGVTQHLDSLNVASGAVVDMVPAGGQVLDVNTLTDSGAIDLTNNDLIVNTPGTAADTIEEAVAAGVTGSATEGIIYSSTAADDPGMTLGVATANQVSGSLSTLDSQSIPSTAVVARYTLQGDVNLDGTVNIQDFNIVSHNYGHSVGTTPPEWAEGDINYDGTINIEDFNLLGAQYGSSTNAVESSVAAGSAFTLDLPTPPSGTAVRWDINWGDGNNNSYAGNASSASHVYTTAGLFQVQFSAVIDTADDGGTGGPDTVYTGQSQTVVATTTGVAATPLSLTAASATDLYAITSTWTMTP